MLMDAGCQDGPSFTHPCAQAAGKRPWKDRQEKLRGGQRELCCRGTSERSSAAHGCDVGTSPPIDQGTPSLRPSPGPLPCLHLQMGKHPTPHPSSHAATHPASHGRQTGQSEPSVAERTSNTWKAGSPPCIKATSCCHKCPYPYQECPPSQGTTVSTDNAKGVPGRAPCPCQKAKAGAKRAQGMHSVYSQGAGELSASPPARRAAGVPLQGCPSMGSKIPLQSGGSAAENVWHRIEKQGNPLTTTAPAEEGFRASPGSGLWLGIFLALGIWL